MVTKNLCVSILSLALSLVSCATSRTSNESSKDNAPAGDRGNQGEVQGGPTTGSSSFKSTVEGPCDVKGNMHDFTINCEKAVKNFTVGFMTTRKSLINTGKINGVAHDLNIENTGTGLKGHEKKASELDITIHFDDETDAAVHLSSK